MNKRIECRLFNVFSLVIRKLHSIEPAALYVQRLDDADTDALEERILRIEEQLDELENLSEKYADRDMREEQKNKLQDMIEEFQDTLEELENIRSGEYEEWMEHSAQLQYQINELQKRLYWLN